MKIETLIVGGGLAGLACARKLEEKGHPFLLIEKERETGGLCRTIRAQGFTFDYTGHFLHFHKPEIRDWVLKLAPKAFKLRRRHSAIFSQGTYSEYPYQENNAGLPSDTVRENVLGYLEAALFSRFQRVQPEKAAHFQDWCLQVFGPGISKHFMFPYNHKLWKTPLDQLTTHWMGRFVPKPRIAEVLRGASEGGASSSGYNATFLYPDQGGISVLPKALAQGVGGLFTGFTLRSLDLERKTAHLGDGIEIQFHTLVCSLPLPKLAALTRNLPGGLARPSRQLQSVSIYNINFGLKGPQGIHYSWVYFPEKEFLFHRAGSVSACVPTAAPKDHYSLYVEFSYKGVRPDPAALGRHAVQKLKQLGWIKNEKQIVARVDLDLPGAYVVYDEHRQKAVPELLKFYGSKGVFSVGRYGRWEYGSMESAIEQGLWAAQRALQA